MILVILAACLFWPAAAQTVERAPQPAFKGMELYSWKPEGKDWHFSLLPGTNRLKTTAERVDPRVAVAGVKAIERKLDALAKGEYLSWGWSPDQPPPAAMVQQIRERCRRLGIHLTGAGTEDEPAK